MTLLLAVIAAILVLMIVGAIVGQDRGEATLRFTQPEELAAGLAEGKSTPAQAPFISPLAPAPDGEVHEVVSLDELMARRQAEAARSSSPESFLPGNLGVGTTLTHGQRVSRVVGVLRFEFNDELWQDYISLESSGRRWRFSVEPQRSFRLAAFEAHPARIEPGEPTITLEGKTFELDESGRANYRAAGDTGHFETGKYVFYDYLASDGTIVNIERFDQDVWQVSLGQSITPESITVANDPHAD